MPNLLMSSCRSSEKLFSVAGSQKVHLVVKRGAYQPTSTAEHHFFCSTDDLQYWFDIDLAIASELSYMLLKFAGARLHHLRLGVIVCGVFMRSPVRSSSGCGGHGFERMVVQPKAAAGRWNAQQRM